MLNASGGGPVEHRHQHQQLQTRHQKQQNVSVMTTTTSKYSQSFATPTLMDTNAEEEETNSAFDDLIYDALQTSGVRSKDSVRQKRRHDDKLVKQLLSTTKMLSGSRVGKEPHSNILDLSMSSTMSDRTSDRKSRLNGSFEESPALIAPALSVSKVEEAVVGMAPETEADDEVEADAATNSDHEFGDSP